MAVQGCINRGLRKSSAGGFQSHCCAEGPTHPGKLESAFFNSEFSSRWPSWPCILVLPPSLFWSCSMAPLPLSWSLDRWAAGFFSGSLVIRVGTSSGIGFASIGYEHTRLAISKEGRRFAATLSPSAYATTIRSIPIHNWSEPITLWRLLQQNESAPDSIESRDARLNSPPPRSAHIHRTGQLVRWEWLKWATVENAKTDFRTPTSKR